MAAEARRILFVCTGNICRSPMAEAFFNHLAERKGLPIRACSAGLSVVLDEATEEAIIVSDEYGVDLSRHRSRQLTEPMVREAQLILTMTEQHKRALHRSFVRAHDRTHTLLEFVGESGDIADPYAYSLEVYRRCGRQIWAAVERLVELLQQEQRGSRSR